MTRALLPISAAALALLVLVARPGAQAAERADFRAKIASAFHAAYNLDQDQAIADAREAVALAPEASSAHRSLAAILWISIIFKRGTVTVDHYLNGVANGQLSPPKPDVALDAEFKRELARALDLATRRLAAAPREIDAREDLGAAYGLQASYAASVDGSLSSAFLAAKHAYDAEETVLAANPHQADAQVIVGTYRYMVSGLGLPTRMLAYMMGFGGGKDVGIGLIDSAAHDPEDHVEAKTALVLIYTREGRHADAMRVVGELAAEFPRNRIFVLEQGSAAIRAGRPAEADALLTRGLGMFDRDDRPKLPGERALWLYKRGLARFGLNQRSEAMADLAAALQSGPVEWVRGRIQLARGKIEDVNGQRSSALDAYRLAKGIADTINDPPTSAEAARLTRTPFTLGPRP